MSVTPQNVNKVNYFIANPQCPSKGRGLKSVSDLVSVAMSHLLLALQHMTIDLFSSTVHSY